MNPSFLLTLCLILLPTGKAHSFEDPECHLNIPDLESNSSDQNPQVISQSQKNGFLITGKIRISSPPDRVNTLSRSYELWNSHVGLIELVPVQSTFYKLLIHKKFAPELMFVRGDNGRSLQQVLRSYDQQKNRVASDALICTEIISTAKNEVIFNILIRKKLSGFATLLSEKIQNEITNAIRKGLDGLKKEAEGSGRNSFQKRP